jgi:hypothetical protein
MTDQQLIDGTVLERVLAAGLRTGADFAEVFVEDRRSAAPGWTTAWWRSSTRAATAGPASGWCGGRPPASPHHRPHERGLLEAAEGGPTAARGAATAAPVALDRRATGRAPVAIGGGTSKGQTVRSSAGADEAARAPGGDPPGQRDRGGRRRFLVANSDGVLAEDDRSGPASP